jgi:acyl-CoA synthetase (NDP forming)
MTASQVASAYGLRVPQEILASTAAEAESAANLIGYPVAMKIASADVPHKSDSGGVRLRLGSSSEVVHAFGEMIASVRAAHPQARILGAVIQPMIEDGQEVIVGVVRDDQFGPLVMFGSGGVEVENLGDVAFELTPLSRTEAEWLVDSTSTGRRLRGGRGRAPADREAAVEAVLRLGQIAVDHPGVAEIEVNPLRVLAQGQGAIALDVRLRLAGQTR